MAQAFRCLSVYWKRWYCSRPVLIETSTNQQQHAGTELPASKRIQVGQKQGRGKLDVPNQCALSVKDIGLQPLPFRRRLILNHKSLERLHLQDLSWQQIRSRAEPRSPQSQSVGRIDGPGAGGLMSRPTRYQPAGLLIPVPGSVVEN